MGSWRTSNRDDVAARIALAGLALGFQSGQPAVWLLAAAAGLLFWGLESLWKFFQYCFSVRIQLLESYFRGEEEVVPDPLQIHTSWFDAFNESESWTRRHMENDLRAILLAIHADEAGIPDGVQVAPVGAGVRTTAVRGALVCRRYVRYPIHDRSARLARVSDRGSIGAGGARSPGCPGPPWW